MADFRHLENRETSYLNEVSSDFDKIWYTTTHLELDDSHITKYEIFFKLNMADGHHIENRFWP